MAYCHNCGQQLEDQAKFCNHCGSKKMQPITMQPSYQQYHSPVTPPQFFTATPVAQKNKRSIPIVALIISGTVLIVAIALLISLVLVPFLNKGKTTKTEGINNENLAISNAGVTFKLNALMDIENASGEIRVVDNPPPLIAEEETEPIDIQVYEFTLTGSEIVGVVELEIPLKTRKNEHAGAAYFDEVKGTWEPVFFQYDGEKVLILTDHLSKFGVFKISDEGKRRAYAKYLFPYMSGVDIQRYLDAISAYAISEDTIECINIGIEAVDTSLALGSGVFGGIMQTTGFLAYGEDVLNVIGDKLEHIGLLTSVVQVGVAVYNGNYHEATVMSLKTALNYTVGKIAGKLASPVMSASMAAIAFVDYSINKFGTEAVQGREDMYDEAYALYYTKGQDGYRSSADWFNLLYPIVTQGGKSDADVRAEIEALVDEYTKRFWTAENKLGVDYYLSEVRPNLAFTGGGAGLNDRIRNKVSANKRAILFREILPGVFEQIARKATLDNQRKLDEAFISLVDYLNTLISVEIVDQEEGYIDHIIRFAPLNTNAQVSDWQAVMFKSTLNTKMSLLGHIIAGSPHTLEVYLPNSDPESDNPVKTIQFKLSPPSLTINLNEGKVKSLTLVDDGRSSNLGQYSVPLIGLDLALRSQTTIPIAADGSFKIQVPYAEYSQGNQEIDHFGVLLQNFEMTGNINLVSGVGTAEVSYIVDYKRTEHSPLEPMAGNTMSEYVTTYAYTDRVSGTVDITVGEDRLNFGFNLRAGRSGFTKLQYHAITDAGDEQWGENPTINSVNKEFTPKTTYQYNIIK